MFNFQSFRYMVVVALISQVLKYIVLKHGQRKKCLENCIKEDKRCSQSDCRVWVDYEKDLNCTIVCSNRHGPLTLHETAERLGVSFVRVKQNQDAALRRLSKILKKDFLVLFK